MSLLLDTHVVLWWLSDDPTLAAELKDRLDHEPDVYVSAATIWEIAIKQSIGKLKLPSWPPSRNAPSFASTVRSATTAPRGVRGLGPRSRNTGTAPGSRFPRAGGRQAVEITRAYLNLNDQVRQLQVALRELSSAVAERRA